jgi:APA family basic amino acid/polyamine antiporter
VLGPIAIALFFVMYSYSGWNAAIYIASEVSEPQRSVPAALLLGTAVVAVLYVALNAAFLFSTPMAEVAGKTEVALVVGKAVLGATGGKVMAALIAFGLVSSISAMLWAGSRVAQTMGEDYRLFQWLAKPNRRGVPIAAVCWQGGLALLLLLTSTFESVLIFIEIVLLAPSFLTVLGVFILRRQQPDLPRAYRTWGYPFTPLVFLCASVYLLCFCIKLRTTESLWGAAVLGAGALVYVLARRVEKQTRSTCCHGFPAVKPRNHP